MRQKVLSRLRATQRGLLCKLLRIDDCPPAKLSEQCFFDSPNAISCTPYAILYGCDQAAVKNYAAGMVLASVIANGFPYMVKGSPQQQERTYVEDLAIFLGFALVLGMQALIHKAAVRETEKMKEKAKHMHDQRQMTGGNAMDESADDTANRLESNLLGEDPQLRVSKGDEAMRQLLQSCVSLDKQAEAFLKNSMTFDDDDETGEGVDRIVEGEAAFNDMRSSIEKMQQMTRQLNLIIQDRIFLHHGSKQLPAVPDEN